MRKIGMTSAVARALGLSLSSPAFAQEGVFGSVKEAASRIIDFVRFPFQSDGVSPVVAPF